MTTFLFFSLLLFSSVFIPKLAAATVRNNNNGNNENVKRFRSLEESQQFLSNLIKLDKKGTDFAGHPQVKVPYPPLELNLPLFQSSFLGQDKKWNYVMIGNAPYTGNPVSIPTVIVPLRASFKGFQGKSNSVVFNPTDAVNNVLNSPIFQKATFPNQEGQYLDSLQRCAFWNIMDNHHEWHVYLKQPKVLPTLDLTFTLENGTLYQLPSGSFIGQFNDDVFFSALQRYLYNTDILAGTLIIFISYDVFGEGFAGFNDFYVNRQKMYNYVAGTWADPTIFLNHQGSDISILAHTLAEWTNNPLGNNIVPAWRNPPTDNDAICSQSSSLAVGDPILHHGFPHDITPYYSMNFNNFDYTLQNVVHWEWFTGRSQSSACNGWFVFPNGNSYQQTGQFCD